MKKLLKKWSAAGLLLLLLAAMAAGCSGKKEEAEPEDVIEEIAYPVSIDGTEIIVGETTVQSLLDKGLKITVSEMTPDNQINEYEIDPEVMLDANSYYSGGSIWISEHTFAHIAMVTDEENIRMGDAVIAYMEFALGSDKADLGNLLFNGMPVTELTRDKAGEMFPDFKGDDNMWFSPAEMLEYNYFMSFDTEGQLMKFSVKKEYDVDWSSGS